MSKAGLETLLTIREVAKFAKCHTETVRRACVTYQRTNGEKGLRHYQREPNAKYLIDIEDVRAWLGRKP